MVRKPHWDKFEFDALRGRTNPVRFPYWADSVTVLGWQKRKLSRIVSDKPTQTFDMKLLSDAREATNDPRRARGQKQREVSIDLRR